MLVKIILGLAAMMLAILPHVASAQNFQNWQYRGNISWNHPDGRLIEGVYANATVSDDRLSLIRDSASGRIYIQFLLTDPSTLLDRQARFFILNGPDKKTARRVYLEVDGRVWPGSGRSAGVIVSQLTKSDVRALVLNSGNLVGVTYSSVKDNDTAAKNRNYMFSGTGLSQALAALRQGRAPATAVAPRPPSSQAPRVSGTGSYFPYAITWQNCTRPRIRNLRTSAEARRFIALAKSYTSCRRANTKRIRAELGAHVRRQGGTFKSTLVDKRFNHRYGQPRGCNCRERFNANVRSSIKAIDAYVQRTNQFTADANVVVRRYNRQRRG